MEPQHKIVYTTDRGFARLEEWLRDKDQLHPDPFQEPLVLIYINDKIYLRNRHRAITMSIRGRK
jgi:hypothetical protein